MWLSLCLKASEACGARRVRWQGPWVSNKFSNFFFQLDNLLSRMFEYVWNVLKCIELLIDHVKSVTHKEILRNVGVATNGLFEKGSQMEQQKRQGSLRHSNFASFLHFRMVQCGLVVCCSCGTSRPCFEGHSQGGRPKGATVICFCRESLLCQHTAVRETFQRC